MNLVCGKIVELSSAEKLFVCSGWLPSIAALRPGTKPSPNAKSNQYGGAEIRNRSPGQLHVSLDPSPREEAPMLIVEQSGKSLNH